MMDRGARHAALLQGMLLCVLGALGGRLVWLQVVRHEEFRDASRGQHLERIPEPALRGDILDRQGRVLATSRTVPSWALDPAFLPAEEGRRADTVAAVAKAADVDPVALGQRVGKGRRFAWIRRAVDDPAVGRALHALELPAGALVEREEVRRFYPMGPLASQVIGFVGIDGDGLEGLERSLDRRLRGRAGERTMLVDGTRDLIAVPGAPRVPAVRGEDVHLTIDAVLQGFAEDQVTRAFEAHGPVGAVCVLLDAKSGDVLALASAPGYDPSRPGEATPDGRRMRAITDMMEPGSTFKPLIAAAAIQCGAVRADERLDTGEGWIRIGKRVVHEHEPRGYGMASVAKILEVSSNCGMARIGMKLGIDRCRSVLEAYGFGRPTGVGLPGEIGGLVTPGERWTETYTLVSVSFGQEIAVTPLQLATAYLPVAGDGTRIPPRLVVEPTGDARTRTAVLSPSVAGRVRSMMEGVVEEGTARNIRGSGYRIAGKTGTAQKMKNGQSAAYVSSFIGMAPAEDPRLVCLVLLDEPSRKTGVPYGSKVAAPYAGEVLRLSLRYMGVRPDGERQP